MSERNVVDAARKLLEAVERFDAHPCHANDAGLGSMILGAAYMVHEAGDGSIYDAALAAFEALRAARDELKAALGTMEPEGPQWGWTEQGYKVRKAIKEWSSQTGQPTEPTPNPTGGQP